jgi:HD-GYP domain-containing protein (c-di-GMP phosphodiesterase class II)
VEQAIQVIESVTRLHAEGSLGPRHHARHARQLARTLGMSDRDIDLIGFVAAIHDVGMEPLRRRLDALPAPLEAADREQLAQHPETGAEMLRPFEYVAAARELVIAHHERWDGTGYPRGLGGEDIPLGARVLAVVDAWESMVAGRPYRTARSREDALAELQGAAGTQFDPAVVEAFAQVVRREGGPA